MMRSKNQAVHYSQKELFLPTQKRLMKKRINRLCIFLFSSLLLVACNSFPDVETLEADISIDHEAARVVAKGRLLSDGGSDALSYGFC